MDTTAEKPIIHVIEDEESININVCEIIKVDTIMAFIKKAGAELHSRYHNLGVVHRRP